MKKDEIEQVLSQSDPSTVYIIPQTNAENTMYYGNVKRIGEKFTHLQKDGDRILIRNSEIAKIVVLDEELPDAPPVLVAIYGKIKQSKEEGRGEISLARAFFRLDRDLFPIEKLRSVPADMFRHSEHDTPSDIRDNWANLPHAAKHMRVLFSDEKLVKLQKIVKSKLAELSSRD